MKKKYKLYIVFMVLTLLLSCSNKKSFSVAKENENSYLQYITIEDKKINYTKSTTIRDFVKELEDSAFKIDYIEKSSGNNKYEPNSGGSIDQIHYYVDDYNYQLINIDFRNKTDEVVSAWDATLEGIYFCYLKNATDIYPYYSVINSITINNEIKIDGVYTVDDLIEYLNEGDLKIEKINDAVKVQENGWGYSFIYNRYTGILTGIYIRVVD